MIDKSTQAERLIAEKRLKEERAKADERLAGELAKADEELARELAKANKNIDGVEKRSSDNMAALQEQLRIAQSTTDQLQSELQSSNARVDEMFYKSQEVNAVTIDTLEWISLGVCPGSNQQLPKLTRTVTGHSLIESNQTMTGTSIATNNEDTSLLPLPSSNPVIQNGIANFDFTRFWELVKPLVDLYCSQRQGYRSTC